MEPFNKQVEHFQQPQQVFQQDYQTTPQVKYAGFWIRLLANIIDSIIFSVFIGLLEATFYFTLGAQGIMIAVIISMIAILLYFVILTKVYKATIGKKILGIVVLNDDFMPASWGKIILRETIGKGISGAILSIGYIMAGFTQRKQALHDMIAKTVVVYKDPNKKTSKLVIISAILISMAIPAVVEGIIQQKMTSDAKTAQAQQQARMNAAAKQNTDNNSSSNSDASSMVIQQPINQTTQPTIQQATPLTDASINKQLPANLRSQLLSDDANAQSNVIEVATQLNTYFANNNTYKGFILTSQMSSPVQDAVCTTHTILDIAPDGNSYVAHRGSCISAGKTYCIENGMTQIQISDSNTVSKTYHCASSVATPGIASVPAITPANNTVPAPKPAVTPTPTVNKQSTTSPTNPGGTSMTLNGCLNQGGYSTNQCQAGQQKLGYINNVTTNNQYNVCCK